MADVLDTVIATASLIVFGSLLVELRIPSVPHSIQQAVMLLAKFYYSLVEAV